VSLRARWVTLRARWATLRWTEAPPPPFASWSRAYPEDDLYLLQDLLMEGTAEGAQVRHN
jgi:hypothetical protein